MWDDDDSKYNSPWNIASDFKVNMNLLPHEIKPMLDDYAQERDVKMYTQAIADELYHYTSGYPYLTSYLCKIIDEDILPKKTAQEWTKDDVFRAFQVILKYPTTPISIRFSNTCANTRLCANWCTTS